MWYNNVICKLVYPDGLMQECSISSAFIMGMLWACTKASKWCRQWPCAWQAASPWLYPWWRCTPIQLTLTIYVALRWQYMWHMSVIIKYKLIHPVGLLLDCGMSSAFATGMLQSCTRPSAECMDSGLVPVWHQVTVLFMMTLCIPTKLTICVELMW